MLKKAIKYDYPFKKDKLYVMWDNINDLYFEFGAPPWASFIGNLGSRPLPSDFVNDIHIEFTPHPIGKFYIDETTLYIETDGKFYCILPEGLFHVSESISERLKNSTNRYSIKNVSHN